MQNTEVHKVIVSKHNFDILSADTEFYAFIGKRLYYTFERFVAAEDRKIFDEHFQSSSRERFFLRLVSENGRNVYFFVRISEGTAKDNCEIELIQVENLVESEEILRKKLSIRDALLELYNDVYFEYLPEQKMIHFYNESAKFQKDIFYTLEQLEEHIISSVKKEDVDAVRQFICDIQYGTRNFGMDIAGDIMNRDPNVAVTSVRGKSIYEDGKLEAVVGYIHFGAGDSIRNARREIVRDSLTGLLSKAEITNLATSTIDIQKVLDITIAIVDVDYFKKVNDTYGHMCGDDVLKRVAGIMEKEVGKDGVVGRIGGDEFLIIFYHADDMENMRERLRSIKNIVNSTFPQNSEGKPVITLSIGCAAYPKDADNYVDLFELADFALYRAKEKGRNRYIIYDKEKHGTLEQIKENKQAGSNRIDNRGNMSTGDIVCAIADKVYTGSDYSLEKFLDDIVVDFGVQRIMMYAGEPYRVVAMAGEHRPDKELLLETQDYINDGAFLKLFEDKDMHICDNIEHFEGKQQEIYLKLKQQEVLSFIQFKFTDRNEVPCILSLESVSRRITWNHSHIMYYRLLTRLLSTYAVEEI